MYKVLQSRMDLRARSGQEWGYNRSVRIRMWSGQPVGGSGLVQESGPWHRVIAFHALCYTTSNHIRTRELQWTACLLHCRSRSCSSRPPPVHGWFKASSRPVHGRFTAGSVPFWLVYCWFNSPVNSRRIAQYNSPALQFRNEIVLLLLLTTRHCMWRTLQNVIQTQKCVPDKKKTTTLNWRVFKLYTVYKYGHWMWALNIQLFKLKNTITSVLNIC